MLKVDQYSYIRTAHRVYGKKIKQIAREKADAEDLAYEALAEGLKDENFRHLQHFLYQLPTDVKVEKVEPMSKHDLEALREIVKKVALRMLAEPLEKEEADAEKGTEAEKN